MPVSSPAKKITKPTRVAGIHFHESLFVRGKKRAIDERISFSDLINRALKNELRNDSTRSLTQETSLGDGEN